MNQQILKRTFKKMAMVLAVFCFTVSLLPRGVPTAEAKQFPVETRMWWNYDYNIDPTDNIGFPDDGASYWSAYITIPEGAKLELLGTYAHARYISLNTYTDGAPTDAIADIEIEPDEGSFNPFLPGAKRAGDAHRNFTITVLDETLPEAPAQNTLYALADGNVAGNEIALIWRVYVADKNRDKTGSVGLPVPRVILADGTALEGDDAYDALNIRYERFPIIPLPAAVTYVHPLTGKTELGYYGFRMGLGWGAIPLPIPEMPLHFPAFEQPDWMKVFNIPHTLTEWYTGATLPNPAYFVGQYATLDNQYTVTNLNRGYGEIAVLRGKALTTPKTYNRVPFMDGEVDVRYWSITTNESFVTTRVVDSVYDEEVPLDEDGYYTIIICLAEDLPSNATESNGVKWLNWGANGDGAGDLTAYGITDNQDDCMVIFRNMLANPEFDHAIQNVSVTGEAESVMEEYLPTVTYMSTEEFEALGQMPGENL